MANDDTAHLLDSQPILFLGCSAEEIIGLGMAGLVTGLVVGIVAAILTGIWLLIIPFPIIFLALFIFKGGKKLGKAKEGFPDGYIGRAISVWMCKHGLSKKFVVRHGTWRIRR